MFDKKEIDFMKSIGLNFNFDDLTDDNYLEMEETVGDTMCFKGLDEDYEPNEIGLLCLSILNKLAEEE